MNKSLYNDFFVIIPVYNEEKNIGQVIQEVKKHTNRIIVVDDGSQDKTYYKAKESADDGIILKHKINIGKGAALKTGCEAAIKSGAKIIVVMDGDGQHNPDDIPRLVAKLKDENLDVVFSFRESAKNVPIVRSLGNKIITKMANFLSNLDLKDILSGFKAFTDESYKKIVWQSQDYSVETEMAINVGKYRLKYAQIPIKTIYKDNYKGMNILNGIKTIFKLLKIRFL